MPLALMECKGLLGKLEVGRKIFRFQLHLDLNFYAAGKLELHEGVDRLGVRAVDVDETLVGRYFELLTALLVDEGRTVDGEDALARGEGDGAAHDGAGGFHVGNDLFCRFLNERVIVALEFDADFLTHCFLV